VVSVVVLELEADAFVDAAVTAGLGAVCARDGGAELFWGVAAVEMVSAITAAMEITE
jgi:hypothetical protein